MIRIAGFALTLVLATGTGGLADIAASPTPSSCSVNHQSVTVIDRGVTIQNGATVKAVSLYSVQARSVKMKIVQRIGAGSYTVVRDMPWPHPGGGWQWFNIPPYEVPASGSFHLGYYYPSTSNNIIGCNALIPRATTSPDIGVGNFTGLTESSSDVAAMAYSTSNMQVGGSMEAKGIVRPDGSGGWSILNDGYHAPANLSSVSVFSDHIEVSFSQAFGQLNTFVWAGDDLPSGVRVDSSGGLGKIGFTLVGPSGVVNPASITNTLANINFIVSGAPAP